MNADTVDMKDMWIQFSLQQSQQLEDQKNLLQEALSVIQDLIGLEQDSSGIAGYDLNGAIEPWGETFTPAKDMAQLIIPHGKQAPAIPQKVPHTVALHRELDKAYLEVNALQDQLNIQADITCVAEARLMFMEKSISDAMQENPSQVLLLNEMLNAAQERYKTLPPTPRLTLSGATKIQQATALAFSYALGDSNGLPLEKPTLQEMVDANAYMAKLNDIDTEEGSATPHASFPMFDEDSIVKAFLAMHAN